MDKVYKTYVKGFDEWIGGGIPEGSIVLLAGLPGTMKSTLAYSILHHNAIIDDSMGMYIVLDQKREKFLKHMVDVGLERPMEGKINVLDIERIRENLPQFKSENWLEAFKNYAKNLKYSYNLALLVFDSLQMLELVVRLDNPRDEAYRIFEWLRDMKMTSILISEMRPDSENFSKYEEEILADGIIKLELVKVGNSMQRRIRCVKMRGVEHSLDSYSLTLKDGFFYAEPAHEEGARPTAARQTYSF